VSPLKDGEYRILRDGWLKIVRADFSVGLSLVRDARMLIGLNQLLFKSGGRIVLVDTGLGSKWSRDEIGLLDYEQPRRMSEDLLANGVRPEDIDVVILSHLHYDHSGGGTHRTVDRVVAPSFTNALYYLHEDEIEAVRNPAPGCVGDYRLEDVEPLIKSGQLRLVTGTSEILPGVTLHHAPGHSPGHQVVEAQLDGETVFYAGDLISTKAHANLKVTMSYDLDRDLILEQRAKWLKRVSEGGWKLFLCHAIRNPVITI